MGADGVPGVTVELDESEKPEEHPIVRNIDKSIKLEALVIDPLPRNTYGCEFFLSRCRRARAVVVRY